MKKIFLLSIILTVLFSCSSDSDIIPDDVSGNINGVWVLKAEYNDIVRQPLSECRLNENLAFEGTSISMVKAEETGNTGCTLSTAEGTFSKTETSLSIKIGSTTTNYKIKELTKTKLFIFPENSAKAFEYERAE
nr:lipocalin family protein [uncultured Flavobacterium sp.]